MKKILNVLLLITAMLSSGIQAKTARIGVALANFDLNFVSILRTQMVHELDAQGMKGQFSDARGDVELQIQQVDDFINQGVDAIILNPVDTQGVLPVINAAKRAGIPLVFVNRKPEVPLTGQMAYVGSDSALSGKMQIEALAKIMNYRGNIAIVMGALSNEEARERTRAVEEFVAHHPDMKVIEKQTARWQRNEAVDVVSAWLLNGTPVNAIVANNDEMAIGAIMALNQAKRKDVLVAGIDGTPDGLQFIKNGEMVVTVFQDARAQATGAVSVAAALIHEQKTANYHWIPYQTVTQTNYPQFSRSNKNSL